MLSGSSSILLSLFGWSFIPDLATRQILNFVYFKSPIRITTAPSPGSLQHRKHYAITFAFVILTYLTYTLVQAARTMQPNFYQILGVSPNVDENGLKLAFRAFAKRHHPDRPEVGKEGEALFMAVRDAFEALKDPVVRFAYDRFGPDVLAWRKTCKTTREFMYQGFMVSSGYHVVTGMALLFWSAISKPSPISFWRYILFASIFAGELSLLLSTFPSPQLPVSSSSFASIFFASDSTAISPYTFLPSSFSVLQTMFPQRVPYQHILFLHQVFMFLSVALTRIVPYFIFLFNDSQTTQPQVNPAEKALLERIYATIAVADREASIILHTLLRSITPAAASQTVYHDPTLARMQPLPPSAMTETLALLTPDIQDLIVEANIKNNHAGPIATAWEAALLKAIRVPALNSDTPLEKGDPDENVTRRVEKSKQRDSETTPSIPFAPHRTKNFWEKEVVEEEVMVPATVSEPRISRPLVKKHSTPRSSPERKASSGGRSGEL